MARDIGVLYVVPKADGGLEVGVRVEVGARYTIHCLSRRQRAFWQEARKIRLTPAKRRRLEARQ